MLARRIKAIEIVIMGFAVLSLMIGSIPLAFLVLFATGTQSVLRTDQVRILPQHLGRHVLLGGNGLVEAATFLSILLGTIYGGVVILLPGGRRSSVRFADGALRDCLSREPGAFPMRHRRHRAWRSRPTSSRHGPRAGLRQRAQGRVPRHPRHLLVLVPRDRIPVADSGLRARRAACGCGRVRTWSSGCSPSGSVRARWWRTGCCAAVSARATCRWRRSPSPSSSSTFGSLAAGRRSHGAAAGIGAFLADPWHWRVLVDLFAISFFGGTFVVPLFAIVQSRASPARRARVIAANNIWTPAS